MNKLDILQAVREFSNDGNDGVVLVTGTGSVATSANIAKHFRIPQSQAAWFLLRLYRQGLLSRQLSQENRDTRGRRPYIYRLTRRGRERMRYLEGQLST